LQRIKKTTPDVVKADGEDPIFEAGDSVKISVRFELYPRQARLGGGRRRVLLRQQRTRRASDEAPEPNAITIAIAIPLSECGSGYGGSPDDSLRTEVFEN